MELLDEAGARQRRIQNKEAILRNLMEHFQEEHSSKMIVHLTAVQKLSRYHTLIS